MELVNARFLAYRASRLLDEMSNDNEAMAQWDLQAQLAEAISDGLQQTVSALEEFREIYIHEREADRWG